MGWSTKRASSSSSVAAGSRGGRAVSSPVILGVSCQAELGDWNGRLGYDDDVGEGFIVSLNGIDVWERYMTRKKQ